MSGPARARTLLGVDYGVRRIGIALGQELTGAARPLATLAVRGGRPDWERLAGLIGDWRPDLLVVGLPRHADGSDNAVTRSVERFCLALRRRFALPVVTVDERLSSVAAEQRLRDLGRRYRREDIDAMAAAVILESWLGRSASDDP